MNLFSNQDPFADRSQLLNSKPSSYQEKLIEQIKEIDTTNLQDKGDFKPRAEIVEKQKVFFWIRLYLKSEIKNLKPNDDILIKYLPSGEVLETKFICYNKKTLTQDYDPNVVNYDPEDDTKALCLMVDSDRINKESEDIPFIRTLFKIGNFYDYQLLKREELEFVLSKNNSVLDYYDVDF